MCLILFAYRAHPQYPLIVAANRDEFYQRPTEVAHLWSSEPSLLAGRDQRAGGTWLGITKKGRFAAVTNYREVQDLHGGNPELHSRGHIPVEFLRHNSSAKDFATQLDQDFNAYAGFNLLLSDGNQLIYYSNKARAIIELQAGIYGLSNGLLDSPWQKVEVGKQRLKKIITDNQIETDILLNLLTDTTIAPQDKLPNTGFPPEKESMLSAAFITSEYYGTCCSTALIVNTDGTVKFHERNYQKTDDFNRYRADTNDQYFEFNVNEQ